jgi:hypothetical protein
MRKLFFGVICSLLFAACNNEKKDDATSPATTAAPASDTKSNGDYQ